VSRSVPGSIRIMASPSQNRSAVNDEITGSDASRWEGVQHRENEKGLVQECSGSMATCALLGCTWNAGLSLFVQGQPCIPGPTQANDTRHKVRKRLINRKLSSLEVRGAPSGPSGKGAR